jgi:hypothetical protein
MGVWFSENDKHTSLLLKKFVHLKPLFPSILLWKIRVWFVENDKHSSLSVKKVLQLKPLLFYAPKFQSRLLLFDWYWNMSEVINGWTYPHDDSRRVSGRLRFRLLQRGIEIGPESRQKLLPRYSILFVELLRLVGHVQHSYFLIRHGIFRLENVLTISNWESKR